MIDPAGDWYTLISLVTKETGHEGGYHAVVNTGNKKLIHSFLKRLAKEMFATIPSMALCTGHAAHYVRIRRFDTGGALDGLVPFPVEPCTSDPDAIVAQAGFLTGDKHRAVMKIHKQLADTLKTAVN